jgi:dTDP-4-amino-4,6-dideoxygalactose transaminase
MSRDDVTAGVAQAESPPAPSTSPSLHAAANYPRARVPVGPILSSSSLGRERGHTPSILDVRNVRLVTSGRVAIALALREMHIGPGDKVLVPSYHCASMIEPVIWAGATPVFYRINPDTSVNLEDIASKLDSDTKLIMATNYFGFPQPLDQIRAFCDARGLKFLEDCAHAFLGQYQGKSVGSYGDYAIASSMKFFPIYEGGALVSQRHSLAAIPLHSAGKGFEAKVALNSLEDAFEYRRLGLIKALLALPMYLKNFVWGKIKAHRPPSAGSMAPGSSEGGFSFDPSWMDKRSALFSRAILKLTSRQRIGQLRRKNYLTLQQALAGMPGCQPLFPVLPDGVYPWVFPVRVEHTYSVFKTLKMAGVPMIRFAEYLWPGTDASVCANSVALSQGAIQFPCHQELSEAELEWMIKLIKEALLAHAAPAKP